MFKILYIKKLLFIFLLAFATLMSCDGRKTKNDALKESIIKFKDSIKPVEIVEYIPKEYSEIKTDTILSNGFFISIKTYTNMEKSVAIKHKVDTITTKVNIYRNWISEVKINMNGRLILDEIIDDKFFLKNNVLTDDFSEDAIITGARFDEEYSIEKDHINLFIGLIYPDSEKSSIYNMRIDKNGNYHIKKELELWETK